MCRKKQQRPSVPIESKQRHGITAVVIKGFMGSQQCLQHLGKWLKTHCGKVGSVKDHEHIIRENNKNKGVQLLLSEGYAQTK